MQEIELSYLLWDTKLQFDGEEYYVGPENQILAKVKVPVEDVLAETKVSEEDKENLTDI